MNRRQKKQEMLRRGQGAVRQDLVFQPGVGGGDFYRFWLGKLFQEHDADREHAPLVHGLHI